LLIEIKEVDLVAGCILSLREGEFLLDREIYSRVCWKKIAEKTKATFCRWINWFSLTFAKAVLQICVRAIQGTQRAVRTAQRPYFWAVFVLLRSI
jgi:hypothetical protein